MTVMADAVASISSLSRLAEIIISLQNYTSRNLTALPPGDDEKLGSNIGVSDSSLDRFIRPWIYKRFRRPDGKTRLPPGTITGETTFKALKDFAGA